MILCRICQKTIDTPAYCTPGLPNYIWPVTKELSQKVQVSKCEVYQCTQCHHLQLQNFTDQEIASFYCHGSFVEENEQHKMQRLQFILDYGGKVFFKNKKVIDVGGGNNPFVKYLSQYTNQIYVNDFALSEECLALIGNNYFKGKLEDCVIPVGEFDMALSFHSLEHLENLERCLSKIHVSLKTNGQLIVEVPNIAWVVENLPYYAIFHQHISMFDETALISLMESRGFKLKKILRNDSVLLGAFEKINEKKTDINHAKDPHYLEILSGKLEYIKNGLKQFIEKNQPQKLGVYTAGGSATLLIHHFDLLKMNVKYSFDRDLLKQNKFIPGTNIEILPPQNLTMADAVIFLSEDIKKLFQDKISVPCISIEEIFKNGK